MNKKVEIKVMKITGVCLLLQLCLLIPKLQVESILSDVSWWLILLPSIAYISILILFIAFVLAIAWLMGDGRNTNNSNNSNNN